MSFDVNNNLTVVSMYFGPGYNIGVAGTLGKTYSERDIIDSLNKEDKSLK